MKPDYDLIRELEHEVEIGLPHEECWDCGTANPGTPLPRLREPIVTERSGQVRTQYVAQKYLDMKAAKWRDATAALLRAAR